MRRMLTALLVILLAVAPAVAQPLSVRGTTNVAAWAKLASYVRFFHPSDQAARAKWDSLLIGGVTVVEPAADDAALADALSRCVAAIAPSVQVWAGPREGGPPPPSPAPESRVTKVAGWYHKGAGQVAQAQSIYRSRRMQVALREAGSAQVAPRGTVIERELAPGVWCRVPITLDVTDDGTWPAPEADAPASPAATGPVGGDDRATRLGDIAIAWGVFRHFYPYWAPGSHAPGIVAVDPEAWLREGLQDAADDADAREFLRTLRRFVARLDDGHGNVWHPELSPSKVLPLAWAWGEVGAGSPPALVVTAAERGLGVKAGDRVVAINGEPPEAWYERERPLISAAREGWRRYIALGTMMTSALEPTGRVTLDVERADGGGASVVVEGVKARGGAGPEPARPANGAEIAPGVRYARIVGMDAAGWKRVLPDLQGARAIVLDCRGYPGDAGMLALQHLADEPVVSARWNVPLVVMPDGEYKEWDTGGRWNLPPLKPRLGGAEQRAIWLTDGSAISYAESCGAIVEAMGLATIVGEPTAGTNGNVNPFSLPGGYRVVWTGMKVLKHDSSPHHGIGALPDVTVIPSAAGLIAGRDEVLEKAIEIAGEK